MTQNRMGRQRRATLRAAKTPTVPMLHYIAGLLEGEATFASTKTSEHITCEMADLQPIQTLALLLGGSVRMRQRRATWKPLHIWSVSGARARGVMLTIYHLLSPRRQEQIRRAFYELAR